MIHFLISSFNIDFLLWLILKVRLQSFWSDLRYFWRIDNDAFSKTNEKKQSKTPRCRDCNILSCVEKVKRKVKSHTVDRKGSTSCGPLSREQQQTTKFLPKQTHPSTPWRLICSLAEKQTHRTVAKNFPTFLVDQTSLDFSCSLCKSCSVSPSLLWHFLPWLSFPNERQRRNRWAGSLKFSPN